MGLNTGAWSAYLERPDSSIVTVNMVQLNYRSPKLFSAGLLAALAAAALLNCRLDAPRQGWSSRWGPPVPHETFPGDCGICHVTE
jgi:hypothetical protein